MTEPRAGCPPWCESPGDHDGHISAVHLHGPISITMATHETRREPLIYVNDVEIPWHCSARLASLLDLLGRDEAAATVRRLAELGEPSVGDLARCTHGGDCQVHPDVLQLHNFDGEPRYLALYGAVD